MHNYKDVLAHFFEFYENFNFQCNFISVVDGRSYDYNSVSNNPVMIKPMAVSTILENDKNSAKSVGAKKLESFQKVCGKAADILNYNDF